MDGRAGQEEVLHLQSLQQLRDEKAALVTQLERELDELSEPSYLEIRIEALEGAVRVAEDEDNLDSKKKAELLRALIDDLRDDHHAQMHIQDYGHHVIKGIGGHTALLTQDHPIRLEHAAQDEQALVEQAQEDQQQGSDASLATNSITEFIHVPNLWREEGRTCSMDLYNRDEDKPWMQLRRLMEDVEDVEAKVMSSKAVKKLRRKADSEFEKVFGILPADALRATRATVWEHTPALLKSACAVLTEPVPPAPETSYGCGDVYVDPARAAVLDQHMRTQMARSGVPVYGQAPEVTRGWLRRNDFVSDSERSRPAAFTASVAHPTVAPTVQHAAHPSAQQGFQMQSRSAPGFPMTHPEHGWPGMHPSAAPHPGMWVPPTSGVYAGFY